MSNKDVTNPGLVNVADEADGETVVNQTIEVSPSYNPGPTISVVTEIPIGHGLPSNNTAANSSSSR